MVCQSLDISGFRATGVYPFNPNALLSKFGGSPALEEPPVIEEPHAVEDPIPPDISTPPAASIFPPT